MLLNFQIKNKMTTTVENNVEFVRKTVNGAELNNVVSLPPTLRNIQVEIIVIPAANDLQEKRQGNVLNLGFWDGPPLPESFFDPLPEEELQAWGL